VVTETVSLIPGTPTMSLSLGGTNAKPVVSASWTAMATATSYTMQYEVGSTITTGYTGPNTSQNEGFINAPSETVNFRVEACNSVGCSAYSPWKSIGIP
jgi:hypothetical protein